MWVSCRECIHGYISLKVVSCCQFLPLFRSAFWKPRAKQLPPPHMPPPLDWNHSKNRFSSFKWFNSSILSYYWNIITIMITISDTSHNKSVSIHAFTQLKKYLTLLLKDFFIFLTFLFYMKFLYDGLLNLVLPNDCCFIHYSNFKNDCRYYIVYGFLRFSTILLAQILKLLSHSIQFIFLFLTTVLSIYHQAYPTILEKLVYRIFTVSYYFPITEFLFHEYNMLSCATETTNFFSC